MKANIIGIFFAVLLDLLAGRIIDKSVAADSAAVAHDGNNLATASDSFASSEDQTELIGKKHSKDKELRSFFELLQTRHESNPRDTSTEFDEERFVKPDTRAGEVGLPEQDSTMILKNSRLQRMNSAGLEKLTNQFPSRKITQRSPRFSHSAKLFNEWNYARSMTEIDPKVNEFTHTSLDGSDRHRPSTRLIGAVGNVKDGNEKQFRTLDHLDDIMMKEQDLINATQSSSCTEPKLDFCGDVVRYPITKAQMSVHTFYDGLAEAALDFLTIQTKGKVGSCKQDLKNILCRDRFPRCKGTRVIWGNIREDCGKAIASCPAGVQELLRNMDLCRKLGEGDFPINKCIQPIKSQDANYCQLKKGAQVAPWNKHASVEVQNLIEIQKALFRINGHCLKKLNDYLCLPAKICDSTSDFSRLTSDFHKQCKDTLKACENTMFSKGMQVFFKCK